MKKNMVVLALCAAAGLLAQGPPPGRGGRMMLGGPGMFGGPGGRGMGMAMGRTITGAPFSAVEVTETEQTLANGNAIRQTTQSNVYRDSMGRVRTDTTLAPRGAGGAQTSRTIVSIRDPVAGVTRELDPQARTAREMTMRGGGRGGNFGAGGGRAMAGRGRGPGRNAARRNDPNAVTENLPMQTINGVQATGIRETRTIPAGEVGNSQPILIVGETWTSADLQIPVMVKYSDPRFGTTTTQLTNIVRTEPDPALFQTPADYTVTRGGGRGGMQGWGPIR